MLCMVWGEVAMNKKMLGENIKNALQPNDNIVFAYLFGSQTKEAPTPLSDVDVAVYLRDNVCFEDEKFRLLDLLSAQLETEKIDLVLLNTAPLSLAGRILESRIVLLDRNPPVRHKYESLVMRESFDFDIFESFILKRRYKVG